MPKHSQHVHACTYTHMYKHRQAHVYKTFLAGIFYLRIIFLHPLSHSQFSTHDSDVSQMNTQNFSPRSPSNSWLPNLAMNPLPSFLLQPIQLTYALPQHFFFLICITHFDGFYVTFFLISEHHFPVFFP